MSTALLTSVIEGLTCGNCGIVFGLESNFKAKRKQDGQFFRCPAGCNIHFTSSENEVLRRQLEEEKKRATNALEREKNALAEAEHFRKSRDGMKGAYRKVAVRVKNGVCPCCKRTFKCLADHMAQKHPDFQTNPTAHDATK